MTHRGRRLVDPLRCTCLRRQACASSGGYDCVCVDAPRFHLDIRALRLEPVGTFAWRCGGTRAHSVATCVALSSRSTSLKRLASRLTCSNSASSANDPFRRKSSVSLLGHSKPNRNAQVLGGARAVSDRSRLRVHLPVGRCPRHGGDAAREEHADAQQQDPGHCDEARERRKTDHPDLDTAGGRP